MLGQQVTHDLRYWEVSSATSWVTSFLSASTFTKLVIGGWGRPAGRRGGACGSSIYSTACYRPEVQQSKPLIDLQWWNTCCVTSWAAPPTRVPSWLPACWSTAVTENRWSSVEQKWRYTKGKEDCAIEDKSQWNCDGSPINYSCSLHCETHRHPGKA